MPLVYLCDLFTSALRKLSSLVGGNCKSGIRDRFFARASNSDKGGNYLLSSSFKNSSGSRGGIIALTSRIIKRMYTSSGRSLPLSRQSSMFLARSCVCSSISIISSVSSKSLPLDALCLLPPPL